MVLGKCCEARGVLQTEKTEVEKKLLRFRTAFSDDERSRKTQAIGRSCSAKPYANKGRPTRSRIARAQLPQCVPLPVRLCFCIRTLSPLRESGPLVAFRQRPDSVRLVSSATAMEPACVFHELFSTTHSELPSFRDER